MPLLLAQKENRQERGGWVANSLEKVILIFGREQVEAENGSL